MTGVQHNPDRMMPAWRPGEPAPNGYRVIEGNGEFIPPRLQKINAPSAMRRPAGLIEPIKWQGVTVPERRWVVEGFVPLGNVTMLNGDGGVGKSLLTMQLLTACATQKHWLGMNVRPCKALGIFCEDDKAELHRRQDDINRHLGIDFGDLENLRLISRVGFDNVLMEFMNKGQDNGRLSAFYEEVRAEARSFGAQIIAIDTAADVFGGNEIIRNQVRRFINALGRIALDCDGAIILTAHPSVAGMQSGTGTSGSTGWNNTVRSRLYLTRPKTNGDEADDGDERVLKRMKSNYGKTGDQLPLRWIDGVFVAQREPTGIDKIASDARLHRCFLDALATAISRGYLPSYKSTARELYAPRMLQGYSAVQGFKTKDIERAMHACMANGKVEVALTDDRKSRQREYIRPKQGADNA